METFLPRGGRGQRAPYETTTIRVPKPILTDVEQLIDQYRAQVMGGEDVRKAHKNVVLDQKLDLEAAKGLAQKLLRAKTSKVETVAKLLSAIYGEEITASNLSE